MLLNLQSLDVVVRNALANKKYDARRTDSHLHVQATAEAIPRNHENPGDAHYREQNNDVSVDSMQQDHLVPNRRHKLEHDEESRRQNRGKM